MWHNNKRLLAKRCLKSLVLWGRILYHPIKMQFIVENNFTCYEICYTEVN